MCCEKDVVIVRFVLLDIGIFLCKYWLSVILLIFDVFLEVNGFICKCVGFLNVIVVIRILKIMYVR